MTIGETKDKVDTPRYLKQHRGRVNTDITQVLTE